MNLLKIFIDMPKNYALEKKKQKCRQDLVFLEIAFLWSPDTKIVSVFDRQAAFKNF